MDRKKEKEVSRRIDQLDASKQAEGARAEC
jgi:hypothetical protein